MFAKETVKMMADLDLIKSENDIICNTHLMFKIYTIFRNM